MIGLLAGGMLVVLAAVSLYLAAPNQKWGPLPWPPAVMRWLGVLLLVAGTVWLLGWAGSATAIFIAMTIVMTVWSIVPVAIAWWRGVPRDRR